LQRVLTCHRQLLVTRSVFLHLSNAHYRGMKAGNSALIKWKTVGGILAVQTSIATKQVWISKSLSRPAKSLSRPVHVISTCRAPGKEGCRRESAQENPRTSVVRVFLHLSHYLPFDCF
jgi:hypothetical protein